MIFHSANVQTQYRPDCNPLASPFVHSVTNLRWTALITPVICDLDGGVGDDSCSRGCVATVAVGIREIDDQTCTTIVYSDYYY